MLAHSHALLQPILAIPGHGLVSAGLCPWHTGQSCDRGRISPHCRQHQPHREPLDWEPRCLHHLGAASRSAAPAGPALPGMAQSLLPVRLNGPDWERETPEAAESECGCHGGACISGTRAKGHHYRTRGP